MPPIFPASPFKELLKDVSIQVREHALGVARAGCVLVFEGRGREGSSEPQVQAEASGGPSAFGREGLSRHSCL